MALKGRKKIVGGGPVNVPFFVGTAKLAGITHATRPGGGSKHGQ